MGRLIFHSFFFSLNLEGPQIENDQLSDSFPLSLNASFFKMRGVPSTGLGGKGEGRDGRPGSRNICRAREEGGLLGVPQACTGGRDPFYLSLAFAHKARVR